MAQHYNKYEYIIIPINFVAKESTEIQLNSLGRSGWELVYVDKDTNEAVFKRYRSEDKEILKG